MRTILAKYPDRIISLRKISQKEIPKILEKGPSKLAAIYKIIQDKNTNLCDGFVKCTCGDKETGRPEWKHQIRWALQDLSYTGKINYERETREYSLK